MTMTDSQCAALERLDYLRTYVPNLGPERSVSFHRCTTLRD